MIIDKLKEKWERKYSDDDDYYHLDEYIDEILSDLEELRPYVDYYDKIKRIGELSGLFTMSDIERAEYDRIFRELAVIEEQIRSKQ
jgi:hypothetical protein